MGEHSGKALKMPGESSPLDCGGKRSSTPPFLVKRRPDYTGACNSKRRRATLAAAVQDNTRTRTSSTASAGYYPGSIDERLALSSLAPLTVVQPNLFASCFARAHRKRKCWPWKYANRAAIAV